MRDLLASARAGDGDAFRELVEPYRRELHVHCYRMLGSVQDAEDLLQETLLAAWRGLDRFEERASLRVWLYRIATNRCLNALRARGRRPEEPRMVEPPEPTRLSEPYWLEPYPDVLLDGLSDVALGPEARYERDESIALGFVAALQHLPPQQRCVLVLRDALGFSTAEVAGILDTGEGAVRARCNERVRRCANGSSTRRRGRACCRPRPVPARSSGSSRRLSKRATSREWWHCSPTTPG